MYISKIKRSELKNIHNKVDNDSVSKGMVNIKVNKVDLMPVVKLLSQVLFAS